MALTGTEYFPTDRPFLLSEAPNHFGEHSKTDIYLCIYGRKKVNNERTDRPVLPFWLSHSSHLSDNLLKGAQNNISQVITHFFTRISLDFCHNFCLTFALFFVFTDWRGISYPESKLSFYIRFFWTDCRLQMGSTLASSFGKNNCSENIIE